MLKLLLASAVVIGSFNTAYAVDEHTKCPAVLEAASSGDSQTLHEIGLFFNAEFTAFDKMLAKNGKLEVMPVMNDLRRYKIVSAMFTVCKNNLDFDLETVGMVGYETARIAYLGD